MADLTALSPNLNFPLYIVAPEEPEKVARELQRHTFRTLGLHLRRGYFSTEALLDAGEHVMRWGQGAAAIDRWARRAGVARDDARHA